MPDVVFWGAAGHAKVLAEAIAGTEIRLLALVDNRPVSSPIQNVPVLFTIKAFDGWLTGRPKNEALHFVIAVGGGRGQDRFDLMATLEGRGLKPMTIIHPRAFVARDAEIGPGSQILAQAAVCSQTRLGRSVIVNTSASIDHECVVHDCVHVAPGAHIAGEVVIGFGAFIGTGAVVLPRVKVGAFATVGAGAVVTHDVPDRMTVVGNPARPMV